MFRFILILGSFFLVSCVSSPGSKEKIINAGGGIATLLVPSEFREVYYKKDHTAERYCRSPSPDFSVQGSDGIGIGVADPLAKPGEEKVGFSSGQSAFGLGGRSADVLLTRELMFRACELSANIDADGATSMAIYSKFLETVERLSQVQTEKGTSVSSANIKVSAPQEVVARTSSTPTQPSKASSSNAGGKQLAATCVEESDGVTLCTQTPGQPCGDLITKAQCWP